MLLGPNTFPLERFLAVFGALMAEHGDGDTDFKDLQPGELEVEVYRSGVLMTVSLLRLYLET